MKKMQVVTVVGRRSTSYARVGQTVVLALTPRVEQFIAGGFLTVEAYEVAPRTPPPVEVAPDVESESVGAEVDVLGDE